MLDARRLRLLLELDRLGTIAAVAETLAFTPSAISQQLAQLERETGVKLVERVGRGSRLTPAARVALGPIEEALGHLDAVESALAGAARETAAVVRVASFQSVAMLLLPHVVTRLKDTAPGVRLQIVENEAERALPALAAGEVDLVVYDEYPGNPRVPDPRLDQQPLRDDPLLLALPAEHPLAARRTWQIADLSDETWVLPDANTFYTQTIVRLLTEQGGFAPRVEHRANDLLIVLAVVEAGHAVSVVPDMIEPERRGVALRPIGDPPLTRAIRTAVRKTSATHPALRVVRAALADALARRADRRRAA